MLLIGLSLPANLAMTVRFVAEHHEYLHHLLVFVGVDDGMTPGLDLEAEVLPVAANFASGDTLILRCGHATSTSLRLPMQVLAGKKDVRVQSGHYEIKIPTNTSPSDVAGLPGDDDDTRLLDAAELKAMDPLSFICASCSLVLIQCSNLDGGKLTYHDLPSEYWAELLEAWMCHSDQKLHEHVAQHTSEGLWPKEGQALVGGSYVLFHGSAMAKPNVRVIKGTQVGTFTSTYLFYTSILQGGKEGRRRGFHRRVMPLCAGVG